MSNQFDISKLQILELGLAENFCLGFEINPSGQVVSVTKNWPLYFEPGNYKWQDLFPEIDVFQLLSSKSHRDCLLRSSSHPRMLRCTGYDLQGRHIFVARVLEQYSQASLEMMCLSSIAQQSSGVAHDLSNLVTILLGYQRQIQVGLEQDPLPVERITRASNKILEVSNRIVGLAASMKAMSQRRNLAAPLPMDISEVVAEAMERCESKFSRNNISYSLISESKSRTIVGVSGQISLMLIALVGWCIKCVKDLTDPSFKMGVEDLADQVLLRMSAGALSETEQSLPVGEVVSTPFDQSWEFTFCYFILSDHRGTVNWSQNAKNMHIVLSFPKPK